LALAEIGINVAALREIAETKYKGKELKIKKALVLLELVSGNIDTPFFKHPQVDIGVAIGATVLLVVAGALAGFFPARRAASI